VAPEPPIIILGVDPGTRLTGWGVVALSGADARFIAADVVAPKASLAIEERLLAIFHGLRAIIETHRPQVLALEDPFVGENVRSAMAVGQARTVAMLAGALSGVPVRSYPPARIKQAVAGSGRGEKAQVREMLRLQLGVDDLPADLNATDALAVALCHAMQHRAEALVAASDAGSARRSGGSP
jgi:crossover junction endodeoxyribonuclease RuvC